MPAPSTRDLIVEKADTLFYEGGFEATSFADIAAAVGISRGNFYHHFKTKDDILDAVIARRMERTRAMLDSWQAEGGGPRARMAGHNDWITQGFADGVFLCVGSLTPSAGGAILAHGESRAAYDARIATDPFVEQGVVTAETHEIDPRRTVPALEFLKAPA